MQKSKRSKKKPDLADNLSPAQRRKCMSAVRGKNTSPELCVRKIVHAIGLRYVLHPADLPGKPDLALISHRRVIFVHGCFRHCHSCRQGRKIPATNEEYWRAKRLRTVARDKAHIKELRRMGWDVLVVWECSTRNPKSLIKRLEKFLRKSKKSKDP